MWAVTSLCPQKVVCKSQIYSARAKLQHISDQARDVVKSCFEGWPLCVPFKAARASLHVMMIYEEKARVIEQE